MFLFFVSLSQWMFLSVVSVRQAVSLSGLLFLVLPCLVECLTLCCGLTKRVETWAKCGRSGYTGIWHVAMLLPLQMFLIDILDRVGTQGLKEETPGRPPCARFTCSLTVMSLKDAIRLLEFTNQLGYILYHEHYGDSSNHSLNVQNELQFFSKVTLQLNKQEFLKIYFKHCSSFCSFGHQFNWFYPFNLQFHAEIGERDPVSIQMRKATGWQEFNPDIFPI